MASRSIFIIISLFITPPGGEAIGQILDPDDEVRAAVRLGKAEQLLFDSAPVLSVLMYAFFATYKLTITIDPS